MLEKFSLWCLGFIIKLRIVYELIKSPRNVCPPPAPGFSSGLVYVLPWRIWAGSWIWAVQTATAVQPTERKSPPHTAPGGGGEVGWGRGLRTKAAGPRNEIQGLIIPRHNEQSFHKWIAARLNEILRRGRDQYFGLALWAVTAGCLAALCQKTEKLRVLSETATTLLSVGVTSAFTAVGTKFRCDLKRRHRCPDSFHSPHPPVSSDAGSSNRSRRAPGLSRQLSGSSQMCWPHFDPFRLWEEDSRRLNPRFWWPRVNSANKNWSSWIWMPSGPRSETLWQRVS